MELVVSPLLIDLQVEPIVIEFANQGVQGAKGDKGDPGGTGTSQVFAATEGQTVFTLPAIAVGRTEVFLNGVKAIAGVDYTVNSAIVQWTGIGLNVGDIVEIIF